MGKTLKEARMKSTYSGGCRLSVNSMLVEKYSPRLGNQEIIFIKYESLHKSVTKHKSNLML